MIEMRVFEMDKNGRVLSAERSAQGCVGMRNSPCLHGLELELLEPTGNAGTDEGRKQSRGYRPVS